VFTALGITKPSNVTARAFTRAQNATRAPSITVGKIVLRNVPVTELSTMMALVPVLGDIPALIVRRNVPPEHMLKLTLANALMSKYYEEMIRWMLIK